MSKQLNILLADDDRDDRFFFDMALKTVPISTHLSTVENGEELMNFLANDPKQLPDVIFLDLNMPRKNGHECLLEIKNNKNFQNIPVVIYSTSLHDEIADVLYENGAHYYLKKSNFSELPAAIHKILSMLLKNPQRPSRDSFIINNVVV